MSSDGVIAFRRRGITIGEAYFDEAPASVERVDLMRIVGAFSPPDEGSRQLHTLVVDLSADEDAIFEQMSKDTRSKVRRAMQKDEQGVWTVTTAPLDPDLYGYSFIADGARMIDPLNSATKLAAPVTGLKLCSRRTR